MVACEARRVGLLSVIVSLNPIHTIFGRTAEPTYHISASMPTKSPSWERLRDLRYQLLPHVRYMAQILPPEEEYVNAHPFTQLTYVDKGARNGMAPQSIEAYGFLKTPGALDIAALQWMYGINPDAASGDDTYTLPLENAEGTGWQAIWDTGGVDSITAAGSTAAVTIDLRNATLGDDVHAGGYISRVEGVFGGFSIAHDWDGRTLGTPAGLCVIENAIGGKGDDLLIGNQTGNRLKGKKGADVLYAGGGGDDRVTGGKGRDQFWISAEQASFVEVTDFNPRKDRLVFDVDTSAVTFDSLGAGSQVLIDGRVVAQLPGVTGLDLERHALFGAFDFL